MRRFLLVSEVLLCAALAAGSIVPGGAQTATPAPVLTIHMHDSTFDPAEATVHAGDTVAFVNDDPYAHTVTATDKSFDSKSLAEHATWTQTFSKPGTYQYTCAYHPWMVGKLTVVAAP
ncbi:MAG: cupredoxin domain-containing protein [Vulcanimicrobiaceae bacterium]